MTVDEDVVATRDPLVVGTGNINEGLIGRSWKGLQPDIGKTPVEKFSIGRTGTPSGGYEHPFSGGTR